ncbi:hypothetical protein LTS10_004622 [Elasticomyces elasticus]|nr:hypothetical protein LTS10_004622 [Elasticomyces elasticus]
MATPSTRVSRTITLLPQEIKDSIADECELDDLPTLRLIDRAFDTSGKESLGKRYMQTRTHIYTLDSLTELEKITADPDLAKHIQKIVLVAQRYIGPEYDFYDHYDDEPASEVHFRIFNFFEREIPRGGGHLLQSIFRNLNRTRQLHPTSSAGNIVFTVSQSPGMTAHPWGRRRYLERIKAAGIDTKDLRLSGYYNPQEVLVALLGASTYEHSPILELDARYNAPPLCYDEEDQLGFQFHWDALTIAQPPLAALKSLKLDFEQEPMCWDDGCWERFRNFINAAPNLESLSIASTGGQSNMDTWTLREMGEALERATWVEDVKIRSLELGPWWTTSETLLDFLAVTKRTVQSLKLYRVGLSKAESIATTCWQHVLMELGTDHDHNLSRVELCQVWAGRERQLDFKYELWTQQFVDSKKVGEPFLSQGNVADVREDMHLLACDGVFLEKQVWDNYDWPDSDLKWLSAGNLPGGASQGV